MTRLFYKYVLQAIPIVLIITSCSDETALSALEVKSIAYVNMILRGEYAEVEKDYGSTMKAMMAPGALKTMWEENLIVMKGFQRILGTREEKVGQIDVVFVKCEFTVTTLDVKIIYDKNLMILDLSFIPGETKIGWQKMLEYLSN